MLEIFSFTPWIISFAAALVQSLIMLGCIWFPKDYRPDNGVKKVFYSIFGSLFKGIFGFFGLLMFDTAIMWCLGQFGFENWAYMLPNVIIGLVLGLYYFIRVFLHKPNLLQLVYIIIATIYLLYRIHIVIALAPSMRRSLMAVANELIILLVIFMTMEITFLLVANKLENAKKRKSKLELLVIPLWDLTLQLDKVFSRKAHIGLWGFAVVQALCVFFGTSILIF